ncbi:S49 family peptidase [uncultured Halomonas sp.]|uniref:S49 family peptidase n=1 Tax=uncultured Halomonas sp. TaxID=173971 RepID=UPI0026250A03|nr:S49 family peptidase [uncultured Halomonas sp.]
MRLPQIWLGSDESYTQHLVNRLTYLSDPVAFQQAHAVKLRDEADFNVSQYLAERITEVVGNVGLVKISGSLVADEDIYNMWFGETAYQTVNTAIKSLIEDPNVSQILTIWDTPGGDASGVNDFGSFLKDADKIKPVHAWTGTMALSAGYWGAACCRSIRASELGETGSIGAVAKFRSYARMLEEEGIDTIIARSAPMKAILQSEEPIDDKKRAYLQSKVDQLHTYFVGHVKKARPKLKELSESQWATGETFFADKAIDLGLVDGPAISLNALVSQLQAKIDKTKSTTYAGKTMTTVLSEQMIAQLMSGVTPPGVQMADTTDPAPPGQDEEESEPVAAAETPADVKADASAAKPILKDDGLMAYLQDKVSTLETKTLELTLRAEKAEAKLAEAQGLDDLLRPIVIEATQRLQVALGQAPSTFAEVPSRALAGSYRATLEEFEKRFQPGRRSLQAQDDSRQPKSLAELRLVSSGR